MENSCIAEFTGNGTRIQLIAQENDYVVFTRVLANWDLDDVDWFDKKEQAIARFLFLTNIILLDVK